jgi:hypothetical protein
VATTLQNYLTTTRFILHDSNAITFTDLALINCINLARDRVITDTNSPESYVFIPLVTGQESYSFATIQSALVNLGLAARQVLAILGVNFIQTAVPPYIKIPLRPLPFNVLNERYRINPVNSLCEAYSVQGMAQNLFLEPPPSNSTYQAEIRCTWLANNMANYTDMETAIPSPLAEALVPLMAASWAWENNDDMDAASKAENKYQNHLNQYGAAMPPFSYDPYSSIY